MKKSVKIAIGVLFGALLINGCTHTFNYQPTQLPHTNEVMQQQKQQKPQIKDVITESTVTYSNGYTSKYLVFNDNYKSSTTYYDGDKKVTSPREYLQSQVLFDADGNRVENYMADNYTALTGGKTYVVDIPVGVEENCGIWIDFKKDYAVAFDADVTDASIATVECVGFVKNVNTNKPVCMLHVIDMAE